jgi:hypothetical protein
MHDGAPFSVVAKHSVKVFQPRSTKLTAAAGMKPLADVHLVSSLFPQNLFAKSNDQCAQDSTARDRKITNRRCR